jgi:2-polyprenyl-6-methoxyphenol hydroxylase-like FAD-dependent oxidoreductase
MIEVGLGGILEKLMNTKGGARNVAIRSQSGTVLIKGRTWLQAKLSNNQYASVLIPRSDLRAEIADALPEGIIRWNSRVIKVTEDQNSVTVELSNGGTVQGDILVGADGARSCIRQQFFPQLAPDQLGLCTTWGVVEANKFSQIQPGLLQESKESLVRTNGRNGCSVLSFVFEPHRSGDVSTANPESVFFWAISLPDEQAKPIAGPDLSSDVVRVNLLAIVKKAFDESSGIGSAVRLSESFVPVYGLTSVNPAIYKSNSIFTNVQNPKSRVTVLGDAAHKTTTQAGLGATAAFLDALDLGKVLIKHKNAFLPEVHLRQVYEQSLRKRAQKVVGASLGNTQRIHQVRGPFGTVAVNTMAWLIGRIIKLVQFVKSILFRS